MEVQLIYSLYNLLHDIILYISVVLHVHTYVREHMHTEPTITKTRETLSEMLHVHTYVPTYHCYV